MLALYLQPMENDVKKMFVKIAWNVMWSEVTERRITESCVIWKYTKLASSQACFPHKMPLLQLVNKLQLRNGFAQVCLGGNVDINPIKSFKSIPKPYKVKKSTARFEMLAGNRNMKSCQLQIQLDLYPSQDIGLDDPWGIQHKLMEKVALGSETMVIETYWLLLACGWEVG